MLIYAEENHVEHMYIFVFTGCGKGTFGQLDTGTEEHRGWATMGKSITVVHG